MVMNYGKPEIQVVGQAASAVQSSNNKQHQVFQDSMLQLATTAAYEADE
jgi:hypothetical protein